jgi:hypothetical protein
MTVISVFCSDIDWYGVYISKAYKMISMERHDKQGVRFLLTAGLGMMGEDPKEWESTINYLVDTPVRYTRFAHEPGGGKQH